MPNGVVEDYTFDNMDRLDVMRQYASDGNNANLADNAIRAMYDYSYRADGKRISSVESFGGTGTGSLPVNPVLTNSYTWTYDNAGRLISETIDSSDDTLDQTESYTVDLLGNRVRRVVDKPNTANDKTDMYQYDANDRLVGEQRFAGAQPTGTPSGTAEKLQPTTGMLLSRQVGQLRYRRYRPFRSLCPTD